MIRFLVSLALLASAFFIVPTMSHAQPTQADVYEVTVTSGPDRAFQPQDVTISVGMWVRWVQVGGDADVPPHTVTSTDSNADGRQAPNGVFRRTLSGSGDDYEHHFDEAGVFPYYCESHASFDMIGQITVTGNDSETSPLPVGLALIAMGAAVLAYRKR